jgi:hypothetical protein
MVELVLAEPGLDPDELASRLGISKEEAFKIGVKLGRPGGKLRREGNWFPGPPIEETFSVVSRELDPDAFAAVQRVAVFITNTDADYFVRDARKHRANAKKHLERVVQFWEQDLGAKMSIRPSGKDEEYRALVWEAAKHVSMPEEEPYEFGIANFSELERARVLVDRADEREEIECATEKGVVYPAYFAALIEFDEDVTTWVRSGGERRKEVVELQALPDHFLVAEGKHLESVIHRSPAWGPPSYDEGWTPLNRPEASYKERIVNEINDSPTDGFVYPFDVQIYDQA